MGDVVPDQVLAARSVAALVAACAAGGVPRFVHFWGHRPRPDGALGRGCFSQWWPSPFQVDGRTFASAEHWMMWRKAVLFDDTERAEQVLTARSPAHAKALGREVRGFDEDVWAAHRWHVVVEGSVAKFDADDALRAYLLGTGSRVLVEASPVDRVWGAGLTADHPDADVPARWRGLNLLGFALMEARAVLAARAAGRIGGTSVRSRGGGAR
ncbi:NADAR family protein [Cellulomonas oligotrophica]|uniref:NADAR domain-containing protein n=1 Tax=Cellulomonas oligotrophica TaxID=931536 RepID=A0A7Y9FG89_9CELL|nr:NADAR family protein [Cellulomonas oligotrophica]NYD86332.1 hypothetical protein [Cellulomonas oligotrophica]GIG32777.1 hypothetical protein Col01nite_19360 [Cellulomonas oligotrophica]